MQTRCLEKLFYLEQVFTQILVAPAMGHADTEWFDAFYEACQQLGCRSSQLKVKNIRRESTLGLTTWQPITTQPPHRS